MKSWLALIITFFLCVDTNSQPLNFSADYKEKIDTYLSIHASNNDFSGSVIVSFKGEILFSKSYGKANYELNIPQTLSTKIRVASITKTFTAAGIVLLMNQGILSLEDSLTKFIPHYPNGNKVKIKHLLSHTGGIPSLNNNLLFQPGLTNDSILNYLISRPFEYEPGSSDAYSNTGFFLLGIIIEKVSGKNLSTFLEENVFSKLSMKNTGFYDDEKLITNKAAAYSPGPYNGLMNTQWYSSKTLFGSGNIYSSVEDLYKWGTAIHDKKLFNIYGLPYPYGWGRRKLDSLNYLTQTGYNEGYNAALFVFENGLVISYLNNIGNLLFQKIEKDLPAILLGKPYELPKLQVQYKNDPTKLKDYLGIYDSNNKPFFKIFEEQQNLYFQFLDSKFKNYLFPIGNDLYLMKNEFSYVRFDRQDGVVKSISIQFSKEDKGTVFFKE